MGSHDSWKVDTPSYSSPLDHFAAISPQVSPLFFFPVFSSPSFFSPACLFPPSSSQPRRPRLLLHCSDTTSGHVQLSFPAKYQAIANWIKPKYVESPRPRQSSNVRIWPQRILKWTDSADVVEMDAKSNHPRRRLQ